MIESFGLSFPLNLYYAVLGVLAYGPLEVCFVVWLIVDTERALREHGDKILSKGLVLTVVVFGLMHLALSPKAGVLNALSVTVTFMILGAIFKYIKNSIGPMTSWTLVNGMVTYLVLGCLS